MTSPLHELIAVKVGEPTQEWIATRRATGATWTDIVIELRTEHGVRVTAETLRRWNLGQAAA